MRIPNKNDERITNQERQALLYLPYVQCASECIHVHRVCRRIGVRVVFRSRETLSEMLMNVKEVRKGAVYQVPCKDYQNVYIDETSRMLHKRLVEHT